MMGRGWLMMYHCADVIESRVSREHQDAKFSKDFTTRQSMLCCVTSFADQTLFYFTSTINLIIFSLIQSHNFIDDRLFFSSFAFANR